MIDCGLEFHPCNSIVGPRINPGINMNRVHWHSFSGRSLCSWGYRIFVITGLNMTRWWKYETGYGVTVRQHPCSNIPTCHCRWYHIGCDTRFKWGFWQHRNLSPLTILARSMVVGLLICRGDNVRWTIVMLIVSAWQDLVGTKEGCFVFLSEAIVTYHLNCAVV